MFGLRKKENKKDEAQLFLESVKDEQGPKDPCASADKKLERIAERDAKAHFDIVNLLTLAFVMIFFGTVLLTLTDKQDFTDNNKLTFKSFTSGNYFAAVERKFNEAIPLKDVLHNARSAIKYSFGYGNKTDFIKIKDRNRLDDPYSIENSVDYTPHANNNDFDDFDDADIDDYIDEVDQAQTDDGKHKKLSGIKLTQETTTTETSEAEATTTVNSAAPNVTTTTTTPPETTQPTETTRETEPTQPTETTKITETTSSETQTEAPPVEEPAAE